jgi:hypothetical protein
VYSLEAIEQFIGHSLPYEFPDETLLIKPRATLRRAHSRDHPRGRRSEGRGPRPRAEVRARPVVADVASPQADAAAGTARKKKRRRRRKKSQASANPTVAD